ncbi:MAG: cysteine desulfurase [Lachnospiraceae bacterium]|nr:cysteine desulfurase [Lachnospiraceae bacterium]
MEAYLDNSATTRCRREVIELMVRVMGEDYGNPSSLHNKGLEAEKYIRQAKASIAKTLKVKDKEIVFTSGGTESDNLAIIGSAMANKRAGMHLITTRIEHAAVLEPMKFLEDQGFEVSYLGVDKYGHIDLEELDRTIRDDTILVSVMHTNNEIGAIEPLKEIGELLVSKSHKILFFVDGVQGYGKEAIYPKRAGIDMMSVSGHKILGPKGVGFLYIDEKVKIKPVIFGGGQQKGLRSGTENVAGIAGLGLAAELSYKDLDEKREYLFKLKKKLIDNLKDMEAVAAINGIKEPFDEMDNIKETAAHILSVSFKDIRAEVLLHALEERGIYVSSGSACASNKPALSATLKAIGLNKELLDRTIRFSFSSENTDEEIEYTVAALKELLPYLGRFVRK